MGFSYNVNVLNQKGSPALYTDTFANRPNFGYAGRLFIANDTSAIYEDTGTAWVLIANVSSGAGTLQQVTTNGNTSNVGISVTAGGVSSNSLTITTLTPGSVPFVGAAGLITQDNTNLFFDDTNNRLGINTNTPSNNLDVHGSGTTALIALNNTAGNQSLISFLNTTVAKWRIGNLSTNFFSVLNVGLGTNAININPSTNFTEFTGNVLIIKNDPLFSANDATNSAYFGLASSINSYIISSLVGDAIVRGTSGICFSANNGTTTQLRLTNTGNFLINSTTDDTVNKLQVDGSVKFLGAFNGTSATLSSTFSGTSATLSGNIGINGVAASYPLYVRAGTNERFRIVDGGSGFTQLASLNDAENAYTPLMIGNAWINIASTGVVTISNLAGTGSRAVIADANGVLSAPVSDQLIKENIEPLKYGLETIMKLNPVQFEFIEGYKNYGENLQIGAIAQEVEQIIPEAVFKTTSTGLKGIDYNQFNGIYIKAIQELNERIELLLSRIEYLENK